MKANEKLGTDEGGLIYYPGSRAEGGKVQCYPWFEKYQRDFVPDPVMKYLTLKVPTQGVSKR